MAKKRVHKAKIHKEAEEEIKSVRVGTALGILMSLSIGIFTILTIVTEWGAPLVRIMGSVYLGYSATFLGIIVGMLWGFAKGFLAGYLFILIYQKLRI
jgi:hypothetical protein